MQTEHQTFTQARGFASPPFQTTSPPTSVGSFGQQGREPTPHIGASVGFTSIQSFGTALRASKIFDVFTESFFGRSPSGGGRREEELLFSPRTEFGTGHKQPLEIITLAAGGFINEHSLALAVEKVLAEIPAMYSYVERVTVDMREDPEVEGYRWLAVTVRLRGEVSAILDSERRFRNWLRKVISASEYRKLVLSYEIPA